MKITKRMIDAAENKGACLEALEWLRKKPRTAKELLCYGPAWADWASDRLMSDIDELAYYRAFGDVDAEISAFERGLRKAFPPRKRKAKR